MTLTKKFAAIRTQEGPEAAVRAVWVKIRTLRPTHADADGEVILTLASNVDLFVDWSGNTDYCWPKAADFTAERLRQIEEKREEVEEIQSGIDTLQDYLDDKNDYNFVDRDEIAHRVDVNKRILAIFETQLKELCSGIKPEFLKGETAK